MTDNTRRVLRLHDEKRQGEADFEALRQAIKAGLDDVEAGRFHDYDTVAAMMNDITGAR